MAYFHIERQQTELFYCCGAGIGILMTGSCRQQCSNRSGKDTKGNLAQEVLGFTFLQTATVTRDQEMKLCVRNEILEFLQTEMPTGAGAEATKEWVRSHG